MFTDVLKIGYNIGKLSLWGALLYGTVVPAYRLVESIDSLTRLAHSAREDIETRTEQYRPDQFKGLFRYAQGKEREGEQKVIHLFRRNIADTLGEDCHTQEGIHYELPTLERIGKGKYELRMECNGQMLVIPLRERELR